MIRKITFSNFYSFKGTQVIDFTANKKTSYSYSEKANGDQITKIAGFFGSNASGKTNVMRLFGFLGSFITIATRPTIQPIQFFKTFFNNREKSNFDIEYEISGDVYKYEFEIENSIVNFEKLHQLKSEKNDKNIEIFSRITDSNLKCIFNYSENFFVHIETDLYDLRPDVSVVSSILQTYRIDSLMYIYNLFTSLIMNTNEVGNLNNINFQVDSFETCLDFPEIKMEMDDIISNFDLGLKETQITKKRTEDGIDQIVVNGLHQTLNGNLELPYNYESRGTQALITLLPKIIFALRNNNVVVIDEIESGLHPEALSKIIDYFITENENGSAQLIFSTQSADCMNALDMHQIYLTNKDENGESEIVRLNQVDGVRTDENFRGKYLASAYGAYPEIKI